LVSREGGQYHVALLNLKSGVLEALTQGALDESPSFSPNGSMVIYGTRGGQRGELATVSVDGRVRQRLTLDDSDVREPVWSPAVR
jgi:TolB protein